MDLYKCLKKIVSMGILVDSPTRRVRESFFDYEYIREYEAQIGTARNVVYWTYAEPISAKTPENPPRCHVPLTALKVPSHQFRLAWKWYGLIGLDMYVNRGW